jgi:hypothetical protein
MVCATDPNPGRFQLMHEIHTAAEDVQSCNVM